MLLKKQRGNGRKRIGTVAARFLVNPDVKTIKAATTRTVNGQVSGLRTTQKRWQSAIDAGWIGIQSRCKRPAANGIGITRISSGDISKFAVFVSAMPARKGWLGLRFSPCQMDYAGSATSPLILGDSMLTI